MAFLPADEKQQIIESIIKDIARRTKSAMIAMLDLILPPKCLNCAARIDRAHNICPDCWKDIQFITDPYCCICGYPFAVEMVADYTAVGASHCGACLKTERSFDKAVSALRYDDYSSKMIIGFKHNDRLEYAQYFAKLLKQAGAGMIHDVHVIIPVPLHKNRLSKRRYNQSAVLSNILAGDMGIEHEPDILQRVKDTAPQKGNLNKRKKNIRGAFKIDKNKKARIKDKNILLIDDVYTTGSTVEGCSKKLKKAGAAKVYILTIFRVVSPQN